MEQININEDWGSRAPLYKVSILSEGSLLWNVIHRGIFGEIKLWINEYGHLRCRAIGKISSIETSEASMLEINKEEILRKFLGISCLQWSDLCEALKEKQISLIFNANENYDIKNKSSLEKLWYFICKRRHFLPYVCILGKLCGGVKLVHECNAIPKIIITDIRDIRGNEIP